MKKFNLKRGIVAIGAVIVMMFSASASAQETEESVNKFEVSVGADLVSNYIWRGQNLGAASVQPSIGISYAGLSFGTWGSTSFDGSSTEIDWTLGYEVAGFYVGVTTYYNTGEFFDWKSDASTNLLEANLSYTLPESFPLTISANTMLTGVLDKNADDNQNFSTYAELSYPFSVSSVDMSVAVGMVLGESAYYITDGFSIYNITVGASKSIKITDDYSMAVFSSVTLNPVTEGTYLSLGVSF